MTTPDTQASADCPTPPPSEPGNLSPTAELTALAAHLRRLADRVDDLERHCQFLTHTLTTQILPELAEVREHAADRLTDHAAQIQHLIDTVTTDGDEATDRLTNWVTMDAATAATQWADLANWIAHTLVPWYEITRDQLPDCWALHRPAVIHLAWLHTTRHAAHRPGAAAHLTAEWHTRWLPAVLHTIREVIPRRGARTCGPGHHLLHETERARRHPTGAPRAGVLVGPTTSPTDQLAHRTHWQHYYEHAVTADREHRLHPAHG